MTDWALAEDRLWSVEDASYFLGVPVQTLYSWRGQGVGPPGAGRPSAPVPPGGR